MTDKQKLREALLAKRNSLPPGDRTVWDAAICRKIIAHDWFRQAQIILGYYPIGAEPDIKPALEQALRLGKEVYLPCGDMIFRRLTSLENLIPGMFNIPEPGKTNCQLSTVHCQLQLCLVPGLAFDRDGYRLGYGKGYYDRFLAGFTGHTIGICHASMTQTALPRQAHDLAVEDIISE